MTPEEEEELAALTGAGGATPAAAAQWLDPASGIRSLSAPGAAEDPTEKIMRLRLQQAPWAQRERALGRQMKQADVLRSAKPGELMDAGRVKVARSPLEFMGAGAQRLVGEYRQGQLEGQERDMIKERVRSLDPATAAGGMNAGDYEIEDPSFSGLWDYMTGKNRKRR